MSLKRYFVKMSVVVPLCVSRLVVYLATSPIGDERKWIHKIKQNTWTGVWIVPNLNTLLQAEDAALQSDLIVLYIHGNYHYKILRQSFYSHEI